MATAVTLLCLVIHFLIQTPPRHAVPNQVTTVATAITRLVTMDRTEAMANPELHNSPSAEMVERGNPEATGRLPMAIKVGRATIVVVVQVGTVGWVAMAELALAATVVSAVMEGMVTAQMAWAVMAELEDQEETAPAAMGETAEMVETARRLDREDRPVAAARAPQVVAEPAAQQALGPEETALRALMEQTGPAQTGRPACLARMATPVDVVPSHRIE